MSKNLSLHCGFKLEQYLVDVWEDTIHDEVGIHYLFRFPNGYGASVIKIFGSYGWDNNHWELACIMWRTDDTNDIIDPDEQYILTYPYEIMQGCDVLGDLSSREVRKILHKIMKLS